MLVKEAKGQPLSEVGEVVSKLLLGAKDSIRVSTGFSRDLLQSIRPAVEATLARVREVDLLIDPSVDFESKSKSYDWLFRNPKVSVRLSQQPILHWIMVDRRDFRLEEPHATGVEERNNLLIVDADSRTARRLESMFDSWWNLATPVPADTKT